LRAILISPRHLVITFKGWQNGRGLRSLSFLFLL
jgi:hypothetical protein